MNANTINSKNVISGVNDLATKCPKISAMWSAKNTYTPSEVSVGSNKKAWFVCPAKYPQATTKRLSLYVRIASRSLKLLSAM